MTPQLHNIQIPLDPDNPGGDFVMATARILSVRDRHGVAEIEELNDDVDWVDAFIHVYFQTLRDGVTLKAIRQATDADVKKYRVPVWIQSEAQPTCCDRPMVFVGQLDDDTLCTEPPPDAKMWWHDAASFYVFTCPVCLGVQAIGQQY